MAEQLPMFDAVEIPLTRGCITIVDSIDADFSEFNWYIDRYGYASLSQHFLHRMIMTRMLGREIARWEYVDHIDRNTLNNRRSNLRLAPGNLNNFNSRLRKNNTSGYKGVTWREKSRKWQAAFHFDRKCIYLGLFGTPEEAARAYDAAVQERIGEFARTNVMLGLLPPIATPDA